MRLFGVPIRFHISAFFLVSIVGLFGWQVTGNIAVSAGFVVIFFLSLLTHEFMHVFAARRYGIRCREIRIMMLGAGAMLDNVGDSPGKTFFIAVVGPLTSFVLAAAFLAVLMVGVGSEAIKIIVTFGVVINLIMGAFNVIPMYPLDGGRLAHAVAWKITGDEHRARRIAVMLSRTLIVGLILWSVYELVQGRLPVFAMLWRGLIAMLLWSMGSQELKHGAQRAVRPLYKDDPWNMYFAHPINTYDTKLEEDLLHLMSSASSVVVIENPNQQKHQDGYARWRASHDNGMLYFTEEVLPGCTSCTFLAFRDGMIPAGVAKEVQWFLDRGMPVQEISSFGITTTIVRRMLASERILSVSETRARIRDADGNTIPY